VGSTLEVAAIVTGTVRRAGDRLRVTTQLVSTTDGKIVWDGQYETLSNDVFGVQDQFTREIVAALSPALTAQVADTLSASARGTRDQEAYDLYLKGRYFWIERGKNNLASAITYFRRAVTRDPSFARAHAGLALVYAVLPSFVADASDSASTLMMTSAQRALALDSTVTDAQLALAIDLELQLRFVEAQQRYRAVIALDPSNATAHHWFGMNLLSVGKTDEALVEMRRGTQIDPLAKSPASALGMALLFARRFDEAEAQSRRVLALDSTFSFALWNLGMVQVFEGKPDSAVHTLEYNSRLYPKAPAARSALLFAYAAAGRWADAERIRAELHSAGGDPSGGIEAAVAELVFGNREPLLRLLSTADGKRRYLTYVNVFGCDPRIDPLWADAAFRNSMHSIGVATCALARPWPLPPRPV
jgi:serine/threonine-protein kinase